MKGDAQYQKDKPPYAGAGLCAMCHVCIYLCLGLALFALPSMVPQRCKAMHDA